MQLRLFYVSLTCVFWGILWRNSLRCGTRCFQFHRVCRTKKCSYLHEDSYDRGRALRGRLDSRSRQDFYSHQLQKQQHYFQDRGISHLLADGREDIFRNVFWVQSRGRRNSGKNHRCRGSPGCDSKLDMDWSTRRQLHAFRVAVWILFWTWWFPDVLGVWRCSFRSVGCHWGGRLRSSLQERSRLFLSWCGECESRGPSHHCVCLGPQSERSSNRNFNLWVWWRHNL